MKNNMKKFLALLAIPMLLSGCAELESISDISIKWPSFAASNTELDDGKVADVQEITEAGVTAWLVEDKSLPLVSMQLMFEGAGSSSDPKGKEGRAMFAAAMLDEGAGDLSALAFQKALEEKAIQLSFSTDEDVMIVQLRCLAENLPEAFRLINLALTKPGFSSKDVERKRALALSTLRNAMSNPAYVLGRHFDEMAFTDHPYGSAGLGTEKSLSSISRTDLRNYMDQTITKDRLYMAVAGDVNANELELLMGEHLAALPETSMLPMPPYVELKHQGVVSVYEMDVPQSNVLVASPAVKRQDPDFMAAYILNHIIGGDTLTSVLGTAIREKKGLAYSVQSYLDPMSHSSNFKVRFGTRNEEVREAYDTLKEELAKLAENGVSDNQFEDAVDYITGSFILSLDNNQNFTSYLNTMQRFDLGKDYLKNRNEMMRAVTKEKVNEVAKKMLDSKNWLTVVVGKPVNFEFGPKAAPAP